MTWLLFSSGARPEYRKNVSKFLATPPDSVLQVRYRTANLSPEFIAAHAAGRLKGQTAFLSYLDNRDKTAAVRFVPCREGKIIDIMHLGEVYVIRLKAGRYFTHLANPEAQLGTLAKAGDLPHWLPQPSPQEPKIGGYWAVQLTGDLQADQLVAHDHVGGAHLEGFQNTVVALSERADFTDPKTRMFFNVVDVREESSGASMVGDPPLALKTSRTYRLVLFHFFKSTGSHAAFTPFWFKVSTETADLKFSMPLSVAIESEYDIKEGYFSLARFCEATEAGINIQLTSDAEGKEVVSEARIDMTVESPALIARVALIAATLLAAQSALLLKAGWDWKTFLATAIASILVGVASVYKLPSKS